MQHVVTTTIAGHGEWGNAEVLLGCGRWKIRLRDTSGRLRENTEERLMRMGFTLP